MISEVVEHDRLLERAREIAALVNRNAPLAVRGTRLAIRKGIDLPLHEAEILAEAFRERVVRTDDAKEGPLAFVEKRDPKWTAPMSERLRRRSATRRRPTASPRSRSTGPRCSTPSTARCARRCATPGGW